MRVNIYNFAIFGPIFMKFSPKCKTKKFGILYTILGSFAHFSIGKGQIFDKKIPDLEKEKEALFYMFINLEC